MVNFHLAMYKEQGWADPRSEQYWFEFLTFREWFTNNLCLQGSLSISNYIMKFLRDWGKEFFEWDQVLLKIGCCTMTAYLVTALSVTQFLTQKNFIMVLRLPYLNSFSLKLQGMLFCYCGRHSRRYDDQLKLIPCNGFQHCYEKLEQCFWHVWLPKGTILELIILNCK